MQFRNPETGEVFNTIKEALRVFCDGHPCEFTDDGSWCCPVEKKLLKYNHCDDFAEAHPTEAANLIGCEIVPVPHLAEVLGLVAEQQFAVETDEGVSGYYHLDKSGILRADHDTEMAVYDLCWAINHPEAIIRVPPSQPHTPHLTQPEIAIMKAVGAKYVSINKTNDPNNAILWTGKPKKTKVGDTVCLFSTYDAKLVTYISYTLFPSVHPGECFSAEGELV